MKHIAESLCRTYLESEVTQMKASNLMETVADITENDAEAFALVCLMYGAFVATMQQNGVEVL